MPRKGSLRGPSARMARFLRVLHDGAREGVCELLQAEIAGRLGVSVRAVKTLVAEATAAGWITRLPDGRRNHYRLSAKGEVAIGEEGECSPMRTPLRGFLIGEHSPLPLTPSRSRMSAGGGLPAAVLDEAAEPNPGARVDEGATAPLTREVGALPAPVHDEEADPDPGAEVRETPGYLAFREFADTLKRDVRSKRGPVIPAWPPPTAKWARRWPPSPLDGVLKTSRGK